MTRIGTMISHMVRSVLILAGVLLCAQDGYAAPIRVADRDGYGRIVFDWTAPVRYSATVVGGQLVLQFDQPVTGDVAAAAQNLAGYLGVGRVSPDRRTITFSLRNNFQMRSITVGAAVVVDLFGAPPVRPTQAAAPAPTPQPAAAPQAPATAQAPAVPASPAPLTVRNGRHPDYTRLVFDWPSAIPYTVARQADRTRVTFQRPTTLSVDAFRRSLPVELRAATLTSGNGETTVNLPVPSDQEVRHFVNGNSIVVDLMASAAVATAPVAPAPAPTPAGAIRVDGAGPVQLLADGRVPPPPPAKPEPAQGATPAPASPQVLAAALTPEATSGPSVTATASAIDALPAGAGREVSMVIPWREPAAAAIFRRAGFLWVIFDRYQQLDIDSLTRVAAPYVTYMEQLPYRNNTIVRMVTQPGVNPFVRREGLAWILDFKALPMRPTRSLEVTAQFDRLEPSLFIPITEAGRTIAVEDPEVGDVFLAVPAIPLGYGMFPPRTYPNLELPVTGQGIIVLPKSDGVRALATRGGVEIDAQGGLAVSQIAAESAGMSTFESVEGMERILNLEAWQIGNEIDYNRNKQALQFGLADEREEVREQARYRLAQYQFVNGFFAEALGITRVMMSENPQIENTGAFRALRGSANMMMGRYEEAVDDFNHYSLANEEDIRFWASLARAQLSEPELEAETVIKTGGTIESYPRRIKIPLSILAAETAIEAGDAFGAQGFLSMIAQQNPRPNEQAAINYLEGRLNEKTGELQAAIEQYELAEESQSRLYQTLAARDRYELEHEMGRLSTLDLIDNLEQLRYRWRGDDIELGILQRLSDLYIEQDSFGDALRTLKLAASYFRDDPSVEGVAGRMNEVFEDLYLNGGADSLSPVTAIALFDEFSDLLPPGRRGDEMIRMLADRLVSVDLLDQAALLLERQVEFRLAGPEQARVGGRLALVHLMNREPEKALEVLQDTNSPQLTRELQASRRRLQARALTDLGRPDEAIVLLGADMSEESKQLRAEIYWRSQNWPAAANAIAEMVPAADRNLTLDDDNARLILDWVTALTLAGDDRTATRVRQRYVTAMNQTPFADAFDLITTPREAGLVDFRTVRSQIEQAENFQSFLVEYDEIIGDQGLSSAIN